MKMLLLDVINNNVKFVDADGLDDYYKYIDCRCIDIVYRRIGDVYVNIICDDEGLLVDKPKVSAISIDGTPMLCGNLLIAGGEVTEDGELTSITIEEAEMIMDNIIEITTSVYREPYCVITEMDY